MQKGSLQTINQRDFCPFILKKGSTNMRHSQKNLRTTNTINKVSRTLLQTIQKINPKILQTATGNLN